MTPINFDALPKDNPSNSRGLIPKGTYYALIKKAEMRQPKDPKKPQYLSLQYAIKDAQGKSMGTLFDGLYESNNSFSRYKINRFITALEIPIQGDFELKDLTKIITGKQFIVDITVKEEEGRPPKSEVDIFTNEIYYPLAQASAIFGTAGNNDDNDDVPFFISAEDAMDANKPSTSDSY